MQDSFKHKGLRKQLIEELKADNRITNPAIFEAFFKTEIFEIMRSVAGTSFARDLKLSQILE